MGSVGSVMNQGGRGSSNLPNSPQVKKLVDQVNNARKSRHAENLLKNLELLQREIEEPYYDDTYREADRITVRSLIRRLKSGNYGKD